MKKSSTYIIMLALLVGMACCKKQETPATPEADGERVHITLKVADGGKHVVFPHNGAVLYGQGDKVYVGNGGQYVGTLTYNNGVFAGDITNPTTNDYLHFYFTGVASMNTPTAGASTQGFNYGYQSSTLPVLSYGHSRTHYADGITDYSCMLRNQCALVQFTLVNGTDAAVELAGMNTWLQINFNDPEHPFTPQQSTNSMTLYSENATTKWAVLLPQTEATSKMIMIGSGGSDRKWIEIPSLENNDYLAGGDAIVVDNSHYFSVSAGLQVEFSQGNLQRKDGEGWRFAEHPYDYAGTLDASNWIDLFAWGDNWNGNGFNGTLEGHDDWRILSKGEWDYVLNSTQRSENRYAKAKLNDVNGVILFPDGWTDYNSIVNSVNVATASYHSNTIDIETWNGTFAASGAVFLPCAGYNNAEMSGVEGYYWSSSSVTGMSLYAYALTFDNNNLSATSSAFSKDCRCSVRLVRDNN